jgi:hypothetical protein
MPSCLLGATLTAEGRCAMAAFWIAVAFAYVVVSAVIVVGAGWRRFHPHH